MTDEQLVQRATAGDQDAYTELYGRLLPRATKIAFQILRNHPDKEDAPVDIIAHIFKGLGRFKGESKFSTWATSVATNYALEMYRAANNSMRSAPGGMVYLDAPMESGDTHDTPDGREEYGFVEASGDVAKILEQLPPGYRRSLEVRYLMGLNHREAGELDGTSAGNSKSQVRKALQRSREVLAAMEQTAVPHRTFRAARNAV